MSNLANIIEKSNIINVEAEFLKRAQNIEKNVHVRNSRTIVACEDGVVKDVKQARSISDFDEELQSLLMFPLKRLGSRVFGVNIKGALWWINNNHGLKTYFTDSGISLYFDKVGFNCKDYYEWLQSNADPVDEIIEMPHYPDLIEGVFYLPNKIPKQKYTGKLDTLIDFFNPMTVHDRTLIKAMFITPFWSGAGGTRPAFVITGDDEDEKGGIGVGKSILSQSVAMVAGKMHEFSEKTRPEDITRALINSAGYRIVRFDNVKSSKFSSDILEALVTQPYITGHKLYEGSSTKHNNLTYIFTFNGVAFSKDMAQRALPIVLDRPDYGKTSWMQDLTDFITKNRLGIISDIREVLSLPPVEYKNKIRFATWAKNVFSKVVSDESIFEHIILAQERIDGDEDEKEIIEDHISEMIMQFFTSGFTTRNLDPENDNIVITKRVMHEWITKIKPSISMKYCMLLLKRLKIRNLWFPKKKRFNTRCVILDNNIKSDECYFISDSYNKNLGSNDYARKSLVR